MSADALPPAISGKTRLLGFLGDPVIHARSPQNFNPRLAASGHDAVLVPLHVPSDRFEAAIPGLLALANLDGLVVTMPYKERLIPWLDSISERARDVGAVNAARRLPDGSLVGDIFDGVGLVGAAAGIGFVPQGKSVGLIGAGGAGAAIAFALAEAGVASLSVVDRDEARAVALCGRIAAKGGIMPEAGSLSLRGLDLLVHATPVGMAESDGTAIDVADLEPGTAVIDIVTKPATPLLLAAERRGCRTAGGGAMVQAQTAAIAEFLGYPLR
jgi:shikimate dehydrogenase